MTEIGARYALDYVIEVGDTPLPRGVKGDAIMYWAAGWSRWEGWEMFPYKISDL